jgi:hypothetical protein
VRISARGLNRATLARQLLLGREPVDVAEVVRRVVALQAQHPASPYLALWNRVDVFDPTVLDERFADGTVVKATLMRITLHGVHKDDYAGFHQAMQPTLRAARLGDTRFTSTGLTAADADALVPEVLAFLGTARTSAEAEAWLDERLGAAAKWAWWALRQYAPVRHAATGGPWSFGQRPAFVPAASEPRPGDRETSDLALQTLALRYLAGFGPGSVADVAQFALVHKPRARAAIEAVRDRLIELEGPDGGTLYDLPDAVRPPDDVPAPPRLMAMWDSVLLAHADRSRLIPTEYRKAVMRSNGDVLPTVLVDGCVAGVWRPDDAGIEITAFHRLTDDVWDQLAAEAAGLVAFLADREPRVYRRYDRWWADLPAADVRLLEG